MSARSRWEAGAGCSPARRQRWFSEAGPTDDFSSSFYEVSFQTGTAGLARAAPVLEGKDTQCSATSEPKSISPDVFFSLLACFYGISWLMLAFFFFLITFMSTVWDFIYTVVFLITYQQNNGGFCSSQVWQLGRSQ